jgi:hypothetical protein
MHKKILTILFFVLFAAPEATWLCGPVACFAQYVDTAWVRRYNGPGNGTDWACAIAVDVSGNVYVTGSSFGSGTNNDYATVKYYPDGNTAWVRRYNGPGNEGDGAFAIAVDNSGNVYVTGDSWGFGTFYDYATIKYYPNGDTAWVRRYNGPGNSGDDAYAIAVDGSGNVYVMGESWGSGTSWDYATIKYYPTGDTAWVRRYNGPDNSSDYAEGIAVDGSGNVYVSGTSVGIVTNGDYATIKYNSSGNELWVRRYNGPGNYDDWVRAIAVDDSGNVYVTGSSYNGLNYDYATIKYKPNGDTAWVRRYNGPGNGWDEARAIVIDGSYNVYVTGVSVSAGQDEDWATIKYYPNGDTAWVRRYNGPGNYADQAYAIAVDGLNNVYVTGYSGVGTSYDYTTIKYYPYGDIAWLRIYDGPGNGTDYAQAIALDGSNNVYVTGGSRGSGTDYDYATIKYIYHYMTDTLTVVAFSPVDIIVTDPKGDSIGLGFNTIPGADYDTTQDYNHDGDKDDIVTLPNRLVGDYLIQVVAEPGDSGAYDLGIRIDGSNIMNLATNHPSPSPDEADTFSYNAPWYMRGDANGDWVVSVTDVVYLINYLFIGGPGPEVWQTGDANCDETINVSDVVYLINYLFISGPPPCN